MSKFNVLPRPVVNISSSSSSSSTSSVASGKQRLFINSKAKKGLLSWLRPVHEFVRSSLCACVSATCNKHNNNNAYNEIVDSTLEVSSVNSSPRVGVRDSVCLLNNRRVDDRLNNVSVDSGVAKH